MLSYIFTGSVFCVLCVSFASVLSGQGLQKAGVMTEHHHSYLYQNSLVLVYTKNQLDTSEGTGA